MHTRTLIFYHIYIMWEHLTNMDPSFIPWCENIWLTWTLHLYHDVRTFGLHGPFIYTLMWEHLAYIDPSLIPWCENIWPTWTLHLYHDVRTFGLHRPFIFTMMWEYFAYMDPSFWHSFQSIVLTEKHAHLALNNNHSHM